MQRRGLRSMAARSPTDPPLFALTPPTAAHNDHRNARPSTKVGKQSLKRARSTDSIVVLRRLYYSSKEIILREKLFRRNWSRKYEHLMGGFFKKVLVEECRKKGFPADTFEHKPPEDAIKRSPILLKPSPSIPRTTSGRWYISPKHTIEPSMKPGEFRIVQQKFIFLG
ncbi:uncharacterized protein LOC107965072 isoform X2 [Apis mellifera]|uniref:Uncharacterized protein LOC107965072 isoform X2 n=1 Tax=Apis mellifera TaxID=7460 RepID=A0A7M7IJT5_APIME|nr:uncharacterized protein LOC107965072 isoform X2 [Apis mellifera]|eukprot:XP_016769938.1 uncharacterized protein LOC107965072 isoform X2 [Apis mellifera]